MLLPDVRIMGGGVLSGMERTTAIAATDTLRIDFLEPAVAARTICVTFTERANKRLEGPGFGSAFLLQHGIAVISVKSIVNDWYQHVPDDALQTIHDIASGYDLRTGYGSSMGAYGVIRYAKRLNLTQLCAISPVLDIRAAWDKRYRSDLNLVGDDMALDRHVSADCFHYVAYDPYLPEDAQHVAKLQSLVPSDRLILTRVPFGGHPVGPQLRDAGALKQFALNAMHDTRQPVTARRHRNGRYLHQLAEGTLRTRKPRSALLANEAAFRQLPEWGELYIQRCRILNALGRPRDAIIAGRMASAILPANPHVAAFVAGVMRANGCREEAISFLRTALEKLPGNMFLQERIAALEGRKA